MKKFILWLKKRNSRADGINRLMALGMNKNAAAKFSARLATACERAGATSKHRREINTIACQIIAMGRADELMIHAITDLCPNITRAIMDHYGYTHRALLRQAAAGKITATRFIEVIMRKF